MAEKELHTETQWTSHKCENCGYEMYNEKNLNHHQKFCGVTQPNNICSLCDEHFHSPDELSTHLLRCGRLICQQCNISFIHIKALDYHIETSHQKRKTIICVITSILFVKKFVNLEGTYTTIGISSMVEMTI